MAVDQQCGSIRWSSCPLGKHSRQAFCAQHLDILQRARHDVTEGNVRDDTGVQQLHGLHHDGDK